MPEIDRAGRSIYFFRDERRDESRKYVIVADLGIDKLMVYRFDTETGTLEPNDPPSEAGPAN